MTTICYDAQHMTVRVSGHAGAAPAGRDMVCLAISALTNALLERGEEFGAQIQIDAGRPEVTVRCRPGREREAACREMLATVTAGYRAIEREYPAHVRVRIEGP